MSGLFIGMNVKNEGLDGWTLYTDECTFYLANVHVAFYLHNKSKQL